MTLLIATTNTSKLREIRELLGSCPVRLLTLGDAPPVPEPDESGQTFAENARLKAMYYHQATGLPTVGEDSGLEIDLLGGLPGVLSARWEGTDYQVKFRRIYELLRERGQAGSAARFVCAVALANEGRIEYEVEGTVEGEIAPEPRGSHGFGYDPIFLYPPLGRTLAEVTDEVKASLSHRGSAFRALRRHLIDLPTFQ